MRPSLLLAVLLCVALCVATVRTHNNDNNNNNNSNTLKLCGRAFLRAVVFTCGGSRWRRLMGDGDASVHSKTETTDVMKRRRRDQNEALLTMCCQLGCRKSDLSLLC